MRWIAILLLIVIPLHAKAGDVEKSFAQHFYQYCVMNVFDLERIQTLARVEEWREIPEDLRPLLKAQEGEHDGFWYVFDSEKSLKYMIAINHDQTANVCSVAAVGMHNQLVIDELLKRTKAKLIDDEIEGYQRYRAYKFSNSSGEMLLNITTPDVEPKDTISISVFMKVDSS